MNVLKVLGIWLKNAILSAETPTQQKSHLTGLLV